MPEKLTNRERMKEITAQIEQGIKAVFESDQYADYLRTMSRFHNYSYRNTMLIHIQKPNATRVAGFTKWKKQFGRYVKKGEKGIIILAPTPFKKKLEEPKLDPDTLLPLRDINDNVIMEEKIVEIPMYRPVHVFDVSQTDGKPLPTLASDLTGDVRNYEVFMEALRRTSPVPISIQPMEESEDGVFNLSDQAITIREGMSETQTVCAVVHEITHSVLHNWEQMRLSTSAGSQTEKPPEPKDKKTMEVEAESVSYAVCQYYGIQTGENSFGYIATWSSDKTLPELNASLETIQKTASSLIADIDRHFAEICKERGIDLSIQEKQPAPEVVQESNVPEPEYVYKVHANPHMTDINDSLFVQAYIKQDDGKLAVGDVLFIGSPDQCRTVWNGLKDGTLTQEQAKQMGRTAPEEPATDQQEQVAKVPEKPEQKLDEYPMPSPGITMQDLESHGYFDGDLIPLSSSRAGEFFEQDLTVYTVQTDKVPEMVFSREDIEIQGADALFSIPREEWESSQEFRDAVADRMQHQEERETAFLGYDGDCFAIYHAAEPIEFHTAERSKYELIYTGALAPGQGISAVDTLQKTFNRNPPADYQHAEISTGDVIALHQDGAVSCFFREEFGFRHLDGFLSQDNPLKNAEMSVEDDCNMIDGIINNGEKPGPSVADLKARVDAGETISLCDLAAAVHRERQEKPGRKTSVRGKLKGQPKQERKKSTPKKSKEREL